MAACCEEASGILCRYSVDSVSNGVPEAMDGAAGGFSEKRLDLRECQLIWTEGGAVGRPEKRARASGLNGFENGSGFVGWQVVQEHGVAGHESWGQDLLEISEEGRAVHGPVDGHGCHHAIKCQAANKARCLPMAMLNRGTAALASRCAAILSGHSWSMRRFHR